MTFIEVNGKNRVKVKTRWDGPEDIEWLKKKLPELQEKMYEWNEGEAKIISYEEDKFDAARVIVTIKVVLF